MPDELLKNRSHCLESSGYGSIHNMIRVRASLHITQK